MPVSNVLRAVRAGSLPRHPPSVVLTVLAIVVVRLFRGDFTAGIYDAWAYGFGTQQAWALLQHLLSVALLAAGSLLAFRLAARQSGAPWVVLAIILAMVWVFPVLGSAVGFVLCTLGLWACHRYIERPGSGGLLLLTLLTVVVGALRADLGLYVALAVVAALFVRHVRDGARAFGRTAIGYTGSLAAVGLLFVPLGEVHTSLDRLSDRITEGAAGGDLRGFWVAAPSAVLRVDGRIFSVRWAPGVDPAQRVAKEREHALVGGHVDPDVANGLTWHYQWDRRSSSSVRRLLNDPVVEDTHGIDRSLRYLRASEIAFTAATLGLRWAWVILPIAAALRLGRRTMSRMTWHQTSRLDATLLPALVLCAPIGGLVVQGVDELSLVAAPLMAALVVIAAWIIAPPAEDRTQTVAPGTRNGSS